MVFTAPGLDFTHGLLDLALGPAPLPRLAKDRAPLGQQLAAGPKRPTLLL
jgi:hypothetical protein